MSANSCNWFLPMTALISALLSVSTLSAQSQSDLSRSGQWPIAGQDVPTFHNDRARSGIQRRETSLTPSNVNTNQFGKLRSFGVDADVYAQPLYVSKSKTSGRNPVFKQRLHALNLADGTEKLHGPKLIRATLPGTGDGGSTVS